MNKWPNRYLPLGVFLKKSDDSFRCAFRVLVAAQVDPCHDGRRTVCAVYRASTSAGRPGVSDSVSPPGRFDGFALRGKGNDSIRLAGDMNHRLGPFQRHGGAETASHGGKCGKDIGSLGPQEIGEDR